MGKQKTSFCCGYHDKSNSVDMKCNIHCYVHVSRCIYDLDYGLLRSFVLCFISMRVQICLRWCLCVQESPYVLHPLGQMFTQFHCFDNDSFLCFQGRKEEHK